MLTESNVLLLILTLVMMLRALWIGKVLSQSGAVKGLLKGIDTKAKVREQSMY
ncbi:hypothetical protein [Marinomonas sp. 2405UD68-3]|uniref:hypothetical protein n=1 Tax=Marinomonas sp. 2405UD68-3 TaxID=3391835 RepID=UPI0039C9F036